MFSYLEKNHNSEMVFDPSVPDIDKSEFQKQDWSNTVYASGRSELKEDITSDFPQPYGKGFTMRVFFDSDHA